MPCQILVAYQCFRPVGDVVDIMPTGTYGKNDSLLRWLDGGGSLDDWPRKFTVVHVTDATPEDLEYLKERDTVTMEGRFYLGVPVEGTDEYAALSTTGEFTCTLAKVLEYLGERHAAAD